MQHVYFILREDDEGGGARVTTDEQQVLRVRWTETRLWRYGGWAGNQGMEGMEGTADYEGVEVVPWWFPKTHLYWGQKVKVTSHKNSAVLGLCTLVTAGFFQLLLNRYNVQKQSWLCRRSFQRSAATNAVHSADLWSISDNCACLTTVNQPSHQRYQHSN